MIFLEESVDEGIGFSEGVRDGDGGGEIEDGVKAELVDGGAVGVKEVGFGHG